MKKKIVFSRIIYKFVGILFCIMMLIIYILNFGVAQKIDYASKTTYRLPNIIILLLGIVVLLVSLYIYKKLLKNFIQDLTTNKCNFLLNCWCIIMFLFQLIYAYNIFFLTGWDVGILRDAAISIGNHQLLNENSPYCTYFSMYPNNVFLLVVFTLIYKLANIFHCISFEFLLVFFSVLSVNLAMWFLAKSTQLLTRSRHLTVLSVIVYTIYIAFSPWIVIPYSDTYVIVFTSSIIYFYLSRKNRNIYVSWFIIFNMSLFGYLIKPTCVIVLIAILIVEAWEWLFFKNNKVKKLLVLPVLLISICLFNMINMYTQKYIGYEKNPDQEFPMTHFLMMGMNEETKGIYSADDVNLTACTNGKNQKVTVHLEVVKERLKKYGMNGYMKLLGKKLLTNYNDGTFAWEREGDFYKMIFPEKSDFLSPFLRNIVYSSGKYYELFKLTQQTFWITILVLMGFSVPVLTREKNEGVCVLMLTVIGITVFLLLFEARARYLFLYSPYYILLACIGLQVVLKFLQDKLGLVK